MVGGCIAKDMGVQSEKVAVVVVEEESTDEKHDVEKAANATEKIHEAVNDQKTTTAASTSKRGISGLDVEESRALLSRSWNLGLPSTKKLLILDVNGLLVARYATLDRSLIPHGAHHAVVAKTYMFKRPFCASFLAFCLENFHVGVWSTMMEKNLRKALEFICPGTKFLFLMHQGNCTNTGMRNPSKKKSPLFLKELARVWARFPGRFSASNTLLIDDTPYKTLWNPPHTAIFPRAYGYDEGDEFLKGTLLEYLKQVRDAPDVQEFVRKHPFGEPAIAPGCLHWDVYRMVLERKQDAVQTPSSADVLTRLKNLSLE